MLAFVVVIPSGTREFCDQIQQKVVKRSNGKAIRNSNVDSTTPISESERYCMQELDRCLV